jgi:fatty-acyl-CoA synthase
MPEATAQTIDTEGFLHTGDLGSLDEQGYLRISGRAREVIIRGGVNIYAAEVEYCMLEHPAIHAAAVGGVDVERRRNDAARTPDGEQAGGEESHDTSLSF